MLLAHKFRRIIATYCDILTSHLVAQSCPLLSSGFVLQYVLLLCLAMVVIVCLDVVVTVCLAVVVIVCLAVVVTVCLVVVVGMAWLIIPHTNWGVVQGAFLFNSWRIFLVVSAVPVTLSVFLFIFFPESPRFLIEVSLPPLLSPPPATPLHSIETRRPLRWFVVK